MRLLNSQQASFEQELTELLAFETVNDPALLATVDDIIAQVRQGGDEVVLKLTQQFDNHPAKTFAELEISQEKLKQAFDGLNPTIKQALELAAQQMRGFGGMMSVRFHSAEHAKQICLNTRLICLAESLGGVESLIEHPKNMTHVSAEGSELVPPDDMVRISIGIEDIDDPLADLKQALDAL